MTDLPTLLSTLHTAQLETARHAAEQARAECHGWSETLDAAEAHIAKARELVAEVVAEQQAGERRVAKLQREWVPTVWQLEMFKGAAQ